MKIFLIKIGCMNYGLCVSDSIEKVEAYYKFNHSNVIFTFEDITNVYDFPVLEINVSQKIKDLIK